MENNNNNIKPKTVEELIAIIQGRPYTPKAVDNSTHIQPTLKNANENTGKLSQEQLNDYLENKKTYEAKAMEIEENQKKNLYDVLVETGHLPKPISFNSEITSHTTVQPTKILSEFDRKINALRELEQVENEIENLNKNKSNIDDYSKQRAILYEKKEDLIFKYESIANSESNKGFIVYQKLFKDRKRQILPELQKIRANRVKDVISYEKQEIKYDEYKSRMVTHDKKEEELLYSISLDHKQTVLDAVLFQNIQIPQKESDFIKRYNIKNISKLIFAIIIIVLLFLFVLNGRYQTSGTTVMFDNWKKEWIIPNQKPVKSL